MATKVGSTLSAGTLKLRSGLAQIEFFSGGAVVLEGPAEFKLLSPREAYLVSGKLRVHAHIAGARFPSVLVSGRRRGFGHRVWHANVEQAALHTSMFLMAKLNCMNLPRQRAAKPMQTISQGRGVRLDRDGGSTETSATSENYVSAADINHRMNTLPNALKRAWQEHQLSVKQDPRLLDYFDFENQQPWERFLSNRARGSQKRWCWGNSGMSVGSRLYGRAKAHWIFDGLAIGCDFRFPENWNRSRLPSHFGSTVWRIVTMPFS